MQKFSENEDENTGKIRRTISIELNLIIDKMSADTTKSGCYI